LDGGGIYGTGRRIEFPCAITVRGYEAFQNSDPVGFAILKEILDSKSDEYKHDHQDLRIVICPECFQ
jgi:hypothetical protein